MAQWRIKEMSNLTKISVRMLHHYDKIGLLKPFVRASNGYRWYSQDDLAKLQQIIALKFFGFNLSQIKTMLQQKPDIQEHLLAQKQMLKEQAESLQQAQDALKVTLERYSSSKSLDWNDLITLIERYCMTKELKKTWAGKLNEKQQAAYISFKQKFPKETDAWDKAITQMNNKELDNPEGPDGQRVVNVFLTFSKTIAKWEATKPPKKMTSSDSAELLASIDKYLSEGIPLNPDGSMWFAKAIITYRLQRWERIHKDITENMDTDPGSTVGKKLAAQWRDIISDQCIGGSKDFFFGIKLLMESAKGKVGLQKQDTKTSAKLMGEYSKMLRDPMAMSWIERALKTH